MKEWTSERSADALEMRSAGALAFVLAELDAVESRLRAAEHWRPSRSLLAELDWLRQRMERLNAQWGAKLAVAIVGPAGVGKSTLLNALAGRPLSPIGLQRPTTRELVVYAATERDAALLMTGLPEGQLRTHVAADAPGLEHLTLVDTPDTNTDPANRGLLERFLERADVVVSLFAAENPRLHDNIAFLAPFLRRLPQGSLLPVLNKVDRVPREQLGEVAADLQDSLLATTGRDAPHVYRVSARAASDGAFPADEEPLHDLNEFDELRSHLFRSLNRADQVLDRRLAHAEHLLAMLQTHGLDALGQTATARREAAGALRELREGTERTLHDVLSAPGGGAWGVAHRTALQVFLAQRWWGPVGWLLTVWALLLRVAAFVGQLGRGGAPLLRVGGPEERVPRGPTPEAERVEAALEGLYARGWPPVADALVRAGFEPQVRDTAAWRTAAQAAGRVVLGRGAQAYQDELERLADRLSVWPLQTALNGPSLGMLAWIAYDTISGFFQGRYLPMDYFRHAGITLLVVWALSFVALQVVAGAGGGRSLRRGVARTLSPFAARGPLAGLEAELEALENLQAACDARMPTAP